MAMAATRTKVVHKKFCLKWLFQMSNLLDRACLLKFLQDHLTCIKLKRL